MTARKLRRCAAPGCTQLVLRREGESPRSHRKRQCCSRECSNRLISASISAAAQKRHADDPPHAPCVVPGCGKPIVRHSHEGELAYARRETCSRECGYKLRVTRRDESVERVTEPRLRPAPFDDGTGSFAEHNIDAPDGGKLWIARPATHVETRSSMG